MGRLGLCWRSGGVMMRGWWVGRVCLRLVRDVKGLQWGVSGWLEIVLQ